MVTDIAPAAQVAYPSNHGAPPGTDSNNPNTAAAWRKEKGRQQSTPAAEV
jgi:hypothetical protein